MLIWRRPISTGRFCEARALQRASLLCALTEVHLYFIMVIKIGEGQQQFLSNSVAIASFALFGGLIIQAFVPILIRASESEISANATIFNRCWMTIAIFGLWNALQSASNRQLESQPKEESLHKILWLSIVMGVCGGASLILWAWSLTQTKVASSTLAFSLTPLFASTLDWFIWGKRNGNNDIFMALRHGFYLNLTFDNY